MTFSAALPRYSATVWPPWVAPASDSRLRWMTVTSCCATWAMACPQIGELARYHRVAVVTGRD